MKNFNVTVNGVAYSVTVEEVGGGVVSPVAAPAPVVAAPIAAPAPVAAPAPAAAPAALAAPAAAPATGSKTVTAPMPGTILKMEVTVGQEVKKDDLVCVLEAMKMENEIFASEGGKVVAINAPKGASVNAGDAIITLA